MEELGERQKETGYKIMFSKFVLNGIFIIQLHRGRKTHRGCSNGSYKQDVYYVAIMATIVVEFTIRMLKFFCRTSKINVKILQILLCNKGTI